MGLKMKYKCKCGEVCECSFPAMGWIEASSEDVVNREKKDCEDHQYIHCKKCRRITHIYIKANLEFSGSIYEDHCQGVSYERNQD